MAITRSPDPRPADPEARTRLLDAAQRLFSTRGFDATRTKEIADHASVSTGLLFYYFPSKQALLEALISERSFFPELHEFLQTACDAEHDEPRETLIQIGQRYLRFLHEHGDIARIMVQAPLAGDDGPFHRLRQVMQAGIDELAGYLERLVRAGRLGPVDPKVFARVFFSSFGFTLIAALPGDPDAYVASTVDLLLHQAPAVAR